MILHNTCTFLLLLLLLLLLFFSFIHLALVPIRDIINCIKDELTKMYPELQQLFETDLDSIAAELLAVSLLTGRAARTPSFDVIINAFLTGFLFLGTIEEVNEHCRKFFNAMYKVGGVFNLAANSVKKRLNISLLDKFNISLEF